MLTSLQLGNFKAFAATQNILIRPLTLIFGPNSAGKSSLLHELLFTRHALDKGELDTFRTDIGGDAVDLGGFRQYIHRRDLSQRVEWGAELNAAGFQGRLAEILAPVKKVAVQVTIGVELDNEGKVQKDAQPQSLSYEITADSQTLVRMSRRPGGSLRMDQLDVEHPVFRQLLRAMVEISTTVTTQQMEPNDFKVLQNAVERLIPDLNATATAFLPSGLEKAQRAASGLVDLPSMLPVSQGRRDEDLAQAANLFFPRTLNELIQGLHGALSDQLHRLQYLGPLRSYPPRHLAFSQHQDPNWYAGGGYAWDVVRNDKTVRDAVNRWLGSSDRLQTPYELRLHRLIAPDSPEIQNEMFSELDKLLDDVQKTDAMDVMAAWSTEEITQKLTKRLLDETKVDGINELILWDIKKNTLVSHRDMGVGVSQVLTVLVQAYASKEKILAVEQPEIHLHPKLQAELGDVFIESALGPQKNTFLLETHSEHLLLRIMRRMRETCEKRLPDGVQPVKAEDVAVLYVEPDGSRSVVREMPLNDRGELVKAGPVASLRKAWKRSLPDHASRIRHLPRGSGSDRVSIRGGVSFAASAPEGCADAGLARSRPAKWRVE